MTIYYLYVKTHQTTGLKYLGYTGKKDPHKYFGSGKRWLNHLRTHGFNYITEIIQECFSKEDVKKYGLYYSKLWNVVNDKNWANLKEEQGDGGGCFGSVNGMYGKTHSISVKKLLGEKAKKQFKDKSYLELYGEQRASELKQKRSKSLLGKDNSYKNNPRFDNVEYTFFNTETGEMLNCTRWVFSNNVNITKSCVFEMINYAKIYKKWCVLY